MRFFTGNLCKGMILSVNWRSSSICVYVILRFVRCTNLKLTVWIVKVITNFNNNLMRICVAVGGRGMD